MPCSNELVSIVIPVHNKEKAKICIEHIKRQTYQNIELILAEFKGFPAEKRNYGYRKSKGSLILFIDEDEYMTPTTISATINKFKEGFEIVGIPQIKVEPKSYFERCASILRENIAKPLFFKREVLEKVGMFRPEYILCDDLDLLIRAFSAGYKLGIIDVKDGYILHDETNSLTGMLQKTFLARRSYKKLQAEYGTNLGILTRKYSQRKRILNILVEQPVLILGTLFIMLVLFVVRRMP
jgi:glycosyltransferase involved in cell wall biosynthesis